MNRIYRERIEVSDESARRLLAILLERYNSESGEFTPFHPVFEFNNKHHKIVLDGNDQANAVLARDDFGIIWC